MLIIIIVSCIHLEISTETYNVGHSQDGHVPNLWK